MSKGEVLLQSLDIPAHRLTVLAGEYRDSGLGTYMDCPFFLSSFCQGDKPDRQSVLIVSGAGFAPAFWFVTPDGRPGWAKTLADAGFDVHILSQPTASCSKNVVPMGSGVTTLSAEVYERLFAAPRSDLRAERRAGQVDKWPSQGCRGDPVFDLLYGAQLPFVENIASTERGVAAVAERLFEHIGPTSLLLHSRGANLGWVLADLCPSRISAIVAVEPHGPPAADYFSGLSHQAFGLTSEPLRFEPPPGTQGLDWRHDGHQGGWVYDGPRRSLPSLAGIPMAVVTGEASYHAAYDHLTVDFLARMGVAVEHVRLGDRGITGNGHLMMLETNNASVAQLIGDWLHRAKARQPVPS